MANKYEPDNERITQQRINLLYMLLENAPAKCYVKIEDARKFCAEMTGKPSTLEFAMTQAADIYEDNGKVFLTSFHKFVTPEPNDSFFDNCLCRFYTKEESKKTIVEERETKLLERKRKSEEKKEKERLQRQEYYRLNKDKIVVRQCAYNKIKRMEKILEKARAQYKIGNFDFEYYLLPGQSC